MNGPATVTTSSLGLPEREARLLQSHLARQLRWNARATVRLIIETDRLGVFAAPPTGVLSYVQLPLVGSAATADMTIPAAQMGFGEPEAGAVTLMLPDPVPGTADLAVLPPGDGWHLPLQGVAGDVMPEVEAAIAEFKARSVSAVDADALAEEIWARPSFGGLPMRVLHTARMLGMLTADSSRIAATTRTGWKRLTTVRGQIYVRVPGALDRTSLTVVR